MYKKPGSQAVTTRNSGGWAVNAAVLPELLSSIGAATTKRACQTAQAAELQKCLSSIAVD
jgi:hypothetical protein